MKKLKKSLLVIYFQIGVNVIGIPEIINHYKVCVTTFKNRIA